MYVCVCINNINLFSIFFLFLLFFVLQNFSSRHINKKVAGGGNITTITRSPSNADITNNMSSVTVAQSTRKEFSFITVHEAFGQDILRDINARKQLKAVCEPPLIVL